VSSDTAHLDETELALDHTMGAHDDHHDLGPTGEDAIEPDETPDSFLVWVGIGLTVTIVVTVVFAVFLFDSTIAAERAAKGYTDASAPAAESH
jgi:hypothetical protein